MYGLYEILEEIDHGPNAVIHLARKEGDKRAYVLKIFRHHFGADDPTGSGALPEDLRNNFIKAARRQQIASANGKRLCAPIYDAGLAGDDEAWYATDHYPRGSLERRIKPDVVLEEVTLRAVVGRLVAALLELRRLTGCSHANLKPANVFVGGSRGEALERSPIFLADPLAGGKDNADAFERADLRALGEIILQLVTGEPIAGPDEYNYPIVPNEAWNRLGDKRDYWLGLCNQFLDPDRKHQVPSLERLGVEVKPPSSFAIPPANTLLKSIAERWPAWVAAMPKLPPWWRKAAGGTGALVLVVTVGWMIFKQAFPTLSSQELLARATNAQQHAEAALGRKAYPEAMKQFGEASKYVERAMKSGGALMEAGNLKSALIRQENEAKQALDCDAAKKKALAAEAKSDWSGAEELWVKSLEICLGDAEITNGVVFVKGMKEVRELLKQAETLTNSDPAQASELVDHGSNALVRVSLPGLSAERGKALDALKLRLSSVKSGAELVILAQKRQTECDDARKAALAAEAKLEWSTAEELWTKAQRACAGDARIAGDIVFVKGMKEATDLLKQAETLTNSQPAQASQLIERGSNALLRVSAFEMSPERRKSVDALKEQLRIVKGNTEAVRLAQKRQTECDDARRAALAAEAKAEWSQAEELWTKAQRACAGDAKIASDIVFVKGMNEATDSLKQAETLTNSNSAQASQLIERGSNALLRMSAFEMSPERRKSVDALKEQLRIVKRNTEAVRLAQKRQSECDEARKAALAAEAKSEWGVAEELWTKAQRACAGDARIASDIVFVKGMREVTDLLKQAETLTNSQPAQASQLIERGSNALLRVSVSGLVPARSNAVDALKRQLRLVKLWGETEQKRLVDCELFKKAAQEAEQMSEWGKAAKLWENAQRVCREEVGIANAIAFSQAMTKGEKPAQAWWWTNSVRSNAVWKVENERRLPLPNVVSSNQPQVALLTTNVAPPPVEENLQRVLQLDEQLEVYLVLYGVKKPTQASFNRAKNQKQLASAGVDLAMKDRVYSWIANAESEYKNFKVLDLEERQQNLRILKTKVSRY